MPTTTRIVGMLIPRSSKLMYVRSNPPSRARRSCEILLLCRISSRAWPKLHATRTSPQNSGCSFFEADDGCRGRTRSQGGLPAAINGAEQAHPTTRDAHKSLVHVPGRSFVLDLPTQPALSIGCWDVTDGLQGRMERAASNAMIVQ